MRLLEALNMTCEPLLTEQQREAAIVDFCRFLTVGSITLSDWREFSEQEKQVVIEAVIRLNTPAGEDDVGR